MNFKTLFVMIVLFISLGAIVSSTELVFKQEYCVVGNDCILNDLFLTGNFSFVGDIVNVTIINQEVIGQLSIIGNISADYFIGDGSLLTGLPFTFWNIINFTNQLDNYLPYFWDKGNASAYYDGRTDRWQLANSSAQGYIKNNTDANFTGINVQGLVNATYLNGTLDCTMIGGGTDADFCVDAEGAGGGGTTFWNMSDKEVYLNDSTKSLRIENITSPFTNKSYITFFSDGSIGITLDPVESPPPESEQQSTESKETKEYTRGTERTCKDGTCNLILYSGTRFVEQDNTWVDVRDARSLKGKGWNVVYLKNDGDHIIDVIDYNYTSITLDLRFVGDIEEYEYEVDDNKIKTKIKIKETLFDEVTGEPYEKETEYEIEIEEGKETNFVYNQNPLGKKFTFGTSSTVIILQDADTENLQDTQVESGNPDTNYGTGMTMQVGEQSGRRYRSYIKFNINDIPSGQLIDEAFLYAWKWSGESGWDSAGEFEHVHHVFNQSWDEDVITWNKQPCGNTFDSLNADTCNPTEEDAQQRDTTDVPDWFKWTVTSMVGVEYDNGNKNMSILIMDSKEGSAIRYQQHLTKEYPTLDSRPYLNITYSAHVAPPTYSNFIKNIADANIFPNSAIEFNITMSDASSVLYWNFSWNATGDGSWVNMTNSTDLTDPSQANHSLVGMSAGDVVGYMFCASDVAGNVGCDSVRTFTIVARPKSAKFFVQNLAGAKQWWVDITGNSWLRGSLNLTTLIFADGSSQVTASVTSIWNSSGGKAYFNDSNTDLNLSDMLHFGANIDMEEDASGDFIITNKGDDDNIEFFTSDGNFQIKNLVISGDPRAVYVAPGNAVSPGLGFISATNMGIANDGGSFVIIVGGQRTATFTTNQVQAQDAGSAGTPSLTYWGDANSGIFWPTVDEMAFSAGGLEFLRFDEDAQDITIFNQGGVDIDFRVETNNNENMFFIDGGNDLVGIGTTTPQYKLQVADTTTKSLNVSDTLYVDGNNKRVGIGTDSPEYTLNINKGGGGRGPTFVIDYDALNPISTLRGGTILFTPSEQNGAGALINTDYWNSVSESRLILQSYNNANQLVLHEGGNVGIGTATPNYKLDVAGTINSSGLHIDGDLNVTGRIFNSLAHIHGISTVIGQVPVAEVWYNISINQTHGLDNEGFIILDSNSTQVPHDGHYTILIGMGVIDSSPAPTTHVAMRVAVNYKELNNSYVEVDTTIASSDIWIEHVTHTELKEGDVIQMQYIADATTITIEQHDTWAMQGFSARMYIQEVMAIS